VSKLSVDAFDAVIFPGGFGAAKNLSTFATQGTDMTLQRARRGALPAILSPAPPLPLTFVPRAAQTTWRA